MLLAPLFATSLVFKFLGRQYGRALARPELLFLYRYLVSLLCHALILAYLEDGDKPASFRYAFIRPASLPVSD